MKKIPSDFTYKKYGLTTRFVNEDDAAFIVSLRTNKKLSKFLHETDNSVEKQKEWIREYKKREKDGKDYYFIFFSDERPVGVIRLYDITELSSVCGSWVCSEDSTMEESLATSFICTEITEIYDIPSGPFTVSKGNNQVLKFHLRMGAEIIGENEVEYILKENREKYNKEKNRYIKLLNL